MGLIAGGWSRDLYNPAEAIRRVRICAITRIQPRNPEPLRALESVVSTILRGRGSTLECALELEVVNHPYVTLDSCAQYGEHLAIG
jgi:hypothetical protein